MRNTCNIPKLKLQTSINHSNVTRYLLEFKCEQEYKMKNIFLVSSPNCNRNPPNTRRTINLAKVPEID